MSLKLYNVLKKVSEIFLAPVKLFAEMFRKFRDIFDMKPLSVQLEHQHSKSQIVHHFRYFVHQD